MDYRFFKMNAGGAVDTAQVMRLASDDLAMSHARSFGKGTAVEIWVGARKIAIVPPAARR